MKKRNRI